MKGRKHNLDYILSGSCFLLVVLGILALTSSSSAISQKNFGSSTYLLFHQIKFGILPGILCGGLCFFLSLSAIRKWTPLALILVLILMGMVFLPKIGLPLGGAARWIKLGPISLQPSEFLKVAFILYLAAWISKRETVVSFKSKIFSQKLALEGLGQLLIPFLIIIGLVSLLLVLQPNISTLGVIILVAILMYFVAQTRILHTFFLIAGGATALIGLIVLAPYRLNRLLTFLEAGVDPMGISYQINQALIAIGAGGIWGRGLGMGIQQFGFLPQPTSDSIFAVFGEETGFIGALVLITLFLIFAWQGFRISRKAPDKFSQLLALGITSWITIQGFVNIGAVIGLLPLTGIPLPFISYGGSHVIAELMGVGILLNISKNI